MAKKEQLDNCIFVKVILMLMVVIGHGIVFWNERWIQWTPVFSAPELAVAYDWINSIHVFAFALVSGYIFAFKMIGGGYNRYQTFLINKVKRLLIPYCFAAFLWTAPIAYICFHWNLTTLVKTFVFCVKPRHLWFLWMLFDVFVIVWPLWKIIVHNIWGALIVSIACYGIGLIGDYYLPNVFGIWTGFCYVPFFIIGIKLRQKHEDGRESLPDRIPWIVWILIHLILFVCYQYLCSLYVSGLLKIIKVGLHFVLNCCGAIMGYEVLQSLSRKINWKDSKIFQALSIHAMPIYLFHEPIIYVVILWLNGKVNPYINACANIAISFSIAFLISEILMKWKSTRFLIGENK